MLEDEPIPPVRLGELDASTAEARKRPGLDHFRECDYTSGFRPFEGLRKIEGRRWTVPEGVPSLPLMCSITAYLTAEDEGGSGARPERRSGR